MSRYIYYYIVSYIFFYFIFFFFFFQAEDGIRDTSVTGVKTCALPICVRRDAGCRRAERAGSHQPARRGDQGAADQPKRQQIGRASCRARVKKTKGKEVVEGEEVEREWERDRKKKKNEIGERDEVREEI